MRRRTGVHTIRGLMLLGLALLGVSLAAAAERVTAIRFGEAGANTRFVIELSGGAAPVLYGITDPNRLVVDIPGAAMDLTPAQRGAARGVISGYRFGLSEPGAARVVMDLTQPVRIAAQLFVPAGAGEPARFIVDLAPSDQQSFDAAAGFPDTPGGAPSDTAHASVPDDHFVVVIDPGHGGKDPGATGEGGLHEKDVVLAVSLEIQKVLSAEPGFHVILTRSDDQFLTLNERVRIARRAGADLFISVHADSVDKPDVRGASVYTLSERASDREAEALARAENAVDQIAGVDLPDAEDHVAGILIDLAQRETKNRSVSFALTLVPNLERHTGVVERPHRSAGFRVLTAPDVPSVLVELGFLSNRADERRLGSAEWRRGAAEAICAAVRIYAQSATARGQAASARAAP